MKALSQTKIPNALPSQSHLNLTCDHVTTMMFGEFQPVHYRHTIKGEHLNLSGVGTIRPFPLACPTFGRIRCNIHHFYVPFRVIFPQYDSMVNDNIGINKDYASLVASSPFFENGKLVTILLTSTYSSEIVGSGTPLVYDFSVTTTSGGVTTTKYYNWNKLGKFVYKILCSLGIEINFDPNDDVHISALPILALCKIYIDYYANQAYLNSVDVLQIRKWLAYNDPVTPLELSGYDIATIFNMIRYCQYEQDYFIGAWDNPFAPTAGQYSAISFTDIVAGARVEAPASGTPYMKQTAASQTTLGSAYLHKALSAITDYQKRHQLAGVSNINRTLAQYGFGVEALKLDRAIHLQSSSIDVQTGAVFSTANTATGGAASTLGDYAGNGFGNGNSAFDYKCDEAGIQISLASILPSGGYFQGMDENNMHVNKLDFYTPEFDGLATQVLRKREVYVSRNGAAFASDPTDYDTAFGHVTRYAEYKRPRSWVTGDFRCPSRFLGADSWHLMREFQDSDFNGSAANIVHSLEFTRMYDQEQYRRIFTMTKSDNDPFYAEFHWDVGSYAPCHGLFDSYEFETEGNKQVSLSANGAALN